MGKTVWRDEAARGRLEAWYTRFRDRVPGPVEGREVPTRHGPSHVLFAGPADAQPVVCLHAMRTGAAHLLSELGPLAARFRLIAPDLPGHSVRGSQVRLSLNDDSYARWLLDVLDGLGLGTVDVFGVSFGGFVARLTASTAPDRVRRLALLVPAGIANGSHWKGLTRMALPLLRYRVWRSERNLRRLLNPLITTWDTDWAAFMGESVRDMPFDLRIPPLATDEELRKLTMPVLVLGAAGDISFPGDAIVRRVKVVGRAAPKADPPERVLRVPDVTGRFPAFKADGDPAEWEGVPRREVKVGDEVVARVAVAHTRTHLWVLAEVDDPSPWVNAGADPKLIFKTGDALDIRLGTDREPRAAGHLTHAPKGDYPKPKPDRTAPGVGDVRVLVAPGPKGKSPVVTAYRPVKPEAKPDEAFTFESPVKKHTFQSVAAVPDVQVGVKPKKTGYVVEVRLPCDRIDLRDCGPGLRLRGDVGVLWGNEAGLATERRAYLFDRGPAAAVVSDTPTEAELHPAEWGVWVFE